MFGWRGRGRGVPSGILVELVEVVFQDRLDAAVREGAIGERPGAGALDPLVGIAVGEPDHPERGPKALLGVRPPLA